MWIPRSLKHFSSTQNQIQHPRTLPFWLFCQTPRKWEQRRWHCRQTWKTDAFLLVRIMNEAQENSTETLTSYNSESAWILYWKIILEEGVCGLEQELVENILEQMILWKSRKTFLNHSLYQWLCRLRRRRHRKTGMLFTACKSLHLVKALKTSTKSLTRNFSLTILKIVWNEIAGMRDIINHHYFDLNAEIVLRCVKIILESLKRRL